MLTALRRPTVPWVHGEPIIEATTTQDFARMADLVRQYADFPLGTADAPR